MGPSRLVAALAALAAAAAATSPPAHTLSFLVPAYFYPSGGACGGTLGYWDCLISAAGTAPALYDGGIVIVNPGSGPGASYDAAYGDAINRTRQAADSARAHALSIASRTDESLRPPHRWGATVGRRRLEVVGYIATGYGAVAVEAVEQQGLSYRGFYNISGFFLDECSTSPAKLDVYRSYSQALRALFAQPIAIVCNFGAAPDEAFVAEDGMLNVSVLDEDYHSNLAQAESPAWLAGYDRSRFANLYHGCPDSSQMRGTIEAILSNQSAVGYTYITDDVMVNPWDRLPSYWVSEIAALSRPWLRYGPADTSSGNPYVLGTSSPTTAPRYLEVATKAIELLRGQSNVYGGGTTWLTLEDGNSSARTQCSSFVTRLWQLTYNITKSHFYRWFVSTSPYAEDYHDTIVNGSGFVRIYSIDDVQPGDVIAMKYWNFDTRTNTGHAMLLVNVSRRTADKSPLIPGTVQYDAWVLDSSKSYHGSSDTRHPNIGTKGGIGMGIARLYVNTTASYSGEGQSELVRGRLGANMTLDVTGSIVGYTWSDYSNSKYYNQVADAMRTLVIGRPTFLDMFEVPVAVAKVQAKTSADPTASTSASPPTGSTVAGEATPTGPSSAATSAAAGAFALRLAALCASLAMLPRASGVRMA